MSRPQHVLGVFKVTRSSACMCCVNFLVLYNLWHFTTAFQFGLATTVSLQPQIVAAPILLINPVESQVA